MDDKDLTGLFKILEFALNDPRNIEFNKKPLEEKIDIIYNVALKELSSRKVKED